MTFLEQVLERKRDEVKRAREKVPRGVLDRLAGEAPPCRGFRQALARGRRIRIIAEIKKASPSAGLIRASFDPGAIAREYEEAGAAAISVLTDLAGFEGTLDHLREVRASVSLPVLRKDFIVDEYQVVEARAAGADAVLLIAAALTDPALASLSGCARDLGLDALHEVHDRAELDRVLAAGADLVGINNRDLHTLRVDLATALELAKAVPQGIVLVGESGIRTSQDLCSLMGAGVHAALIGESLMRAESPGEALRALLDGVGRHG